MKLFKSMLIIIALAFVSASVGYSQQTLKEVKAKGYIQAGVNGALFGFGKPDQMGEWKGLDVDTARAIAIAVFGDLNNRVRYTPLTAKTRFTALQSKEIDVLTRNCTQTLGRDTALGLDFAVVNYYDGQGMMVPTALGVKSATELDGANICTNTGTTTELNITDYFRTNGMSFNLVAFEKADEVVAAYDAGRCDTYTTDKSGLAAQRTKMSNPDEHKVLPETISKEPLGPVVRQGDAVWEDIVRWSLNVMIEAEEYGVNSSNASSLKDSENPQIKRLVGSEGELGSAFGLDNEWSLRIIEQVGNYGEIYEKHIASTGIMPDRGPNELWTKGGILYVAPAR